MRYFQGKPIGYKVIYQPTGLERKAIYLNVNYTTNTTNLTDLAVYTMYIIKVSAVSSGGEGPGNMTMARTAAEGTEDFRIMFDLQFKLNDQTKVP